MEFFLGSGRVWLVNARAAWDASRDWDPQLAQREGALLCLGNKESLDARMPLWPRSRARKRDGTG